MRTAARTLAIAAFLLAALVATEDATPAEAKVGPTILSGGDLPHAISIPFEDSFPLWFPPRAAANMDTFPGWPFRLDTPPATTGTGYDLSSTLEAGLVSDHDSPNALWSDVTLGEGRQPAATYYPAIAALEIRVGDDPPRWARLDDDRVRLLNRYIELGRAGALPKEPTILDVLAAEARLGRSTLLTVDGRALPPDAVEEFWRVGASTAWTEEYVYASLIGVNRYTGAPAEFDEAIEAMVYGYPTPVWLAFDVDGREVRLAYYPTTGVIAGIPLPNNSAWVGRGFVIPPELRESFHAALGLPPIPFPPAEVLAAQHRSDAPAGAAASGRLAGGTGTAAALVLLALASLAAAATVATLIRGAHHVHP